MNSERITEAGSPEEIFLARLADVAPVAEATEQVHLTAALAAVREAEVTAFGRRTALRPTVPLWRKPRMAFSNIAAIIAGLSLPVKAAAASTVAVAAIGGAAVTGNLPTQAENANEGLSNATQQTGFEQLPAHGEPGPLPAGEGGGAATADEAGDERVDGQDRAEEARGTNNDHGLETSTAAKAKSDDRRAAAEARAAAAKANVEQAEARQQEAEARQQEAEARQAEARQREIDAREREEAQQREAEAQARADAEARRQQARDNAATSGGAEAEGEEQSSTGTDRSGAGRANADGAGAR